MRRQGGGGPLEANTVAVRIVKLGQAAGIKVDAREVKGPGGKVTMVPKFASAHDLRRSFGERWASRVMPQVLKELMRHENIETTLRFYVGRNAATTAAVLQEAHRAALGAKVGAIDEKHTTKAVV